MAPRPPELLRTFVALVPSEATQRALAVESELVARADGAARTVPRENLHLTLLFLGSTAVDAVPILRDALERGVEGLVAVRLRPVGMSAFPSPAAARVVFATLAPDARHALDLLATRIRGALASVGHGPDRAERFHAHITLARLEPPSPSPALKKLLTAGALHGTYIDDVITDVRLLSSESVAPSGEAPRSSAPPRSRHYRTLASVPLGATPEPTPEPTPELGAVSGLPRVPGASSTAGERS